MNSNISRRLDTNVHLAAFYAEYGHGDIGADDSNASNLDGKCDATSGDGRIRLAGRFDVLSARSGDGSVGAEAMHGSKLDSGWSIASGDSSIDVAVPADLAANIEVSLSLGRQQSRVEGIRSRDRAE